MDTSDHTSTTTQTDQLKQSNLLDIGEPMDELDDTITSPTGATPSDLPPTPALDAAVKKQHDDYLRNWAAAILKRIKSN